MLIKLKGNPWKFPPCPFPDNMHGNPESLDFLFQGAATNPTHGNIVTTSVDVSHEINQLTLSPIGLKIVYAKKESYTVHVPDLAPKK